MKKWMLFVCLVAVFAKAEPADQKVYVCNATNLQKVIVSELPSPQSEQSSQPYGPAPEPSPEQVPAQTSQTPVEVETQITKNGDQDKHLPKTLTFRGKLSPRGPFYKGLLQHKTNAVKPVFAGIAFDGQELTIDIATQLYREKDVRLLIYPSNYFWTTKPVTEVEKGPFKCVLQVQPIRADTNTAE